MVVAGLGFFSGKDGCYLCDYTYGYRWALVPAWAIDQTRVVNPDLIEVRSLPGYSGAAVYLYSPNAMNDISKRRNGVYSSCSGLGCFMNSSILLAVRLLPASHRTCHSVMRRSLT